MSRRAVQIASGVCVFLTSLIFLHLIHHAFFAHRHEIGPGSLLMALMIAVPVGIFSFIGAYLLLTGGRAQNPD